MATVRPFPITPQLSMKNVRPSSAFTGKKAVNGNLDTVSDFLTGTPVSDLGSLFSCGNLTSIKEVGILSVETDLCLPPIRNIQLPDSLGTFAPVNIINLFTSGNIIASQS
jgi:hypothetical protein